MIAVVKTCQHYRVFYLIRAFTVLAYHEALRSIFKSKFRDKLRVEKLVIRLSKLNFTIKIIPVPRNVVVDALWRSITAKDTSLDKSRLNWLKDLADYYSDDECDVKHYNSADFRAMKVDIGDNETHEIFEV